MPRRTVSARAVLAVALVVGLAASMAVAVLVGSVSVPFDETWRVITGGQAHDPRWQVIIHDIRLPRVLTSALAGAALGVAGLQMQTLFRNALADPYVLGANAGASLGVAVVTLSAGGVMGGVFAGNLAGWGRLGTVVAATLGAGLVLGGVLALAGWVRNTVTLLLLGVMAGAITGSLVSLLVVWANPQAVQQFLMWGMGSFAATLWPDLRIAAPVIAAAVLLAASTIRSLNALLLGEQYARSMGVDIRRARLLTLFSSALLTAAVTAFCGPVGFLGLVVPHIARAVFRSSNHRVVLPACVGLGALLGVWCGVIADLPGTDIALPLNAVTALIGAPVVVAVLLRGRAGQGAIA